jgi:hypothetical protein
VPCTQVTTKKPYYNGPPRTSNIPVDTSELVEIIDAQGRNYTDMFKIYFYLAIVTAMDQFNDQNILANDAVKARIGNLVKIVIPAGPDFEYV